MTAAGSAATPKTKRQIYMQAYNAAYKARHRENLLVTDAAYRDRTRAQRRKRDKRYRDRRLQEMLARRGITLAEYEDMVQRRRRVANRRPRSIGGEFVRKDATPAERAKPHRVSKEGRKRIAHANSKRQVTALTRLRISLARRRTPAPQHAVARGSEGTAPFRRRERARSGRGAHTSQHSTDTPKSRLRPHVA
jgi:hypothetical protein